MHCIQQPTDEERVKFLTPQIRNEIVRDVVAQMFAFEPKPKKQFATEVAQQLVRKYHFLKDVGQGVSGYVSLLFYFRVNVMKCSYLIHAGLLGEESS